MSFDGNMMTSEMKTTMWQMTFHDTRFEHAICIRIWKIWKLRALKIINEKVIQMEIELKREIPFEFWFN